MPKQLSGSMKIPDSYSEEAFFAEQYISPSENITLNGDWWINMRTMSREITPGRGLCLWSYGYLNGREASDIYRLEIEDGFSMKYSLKFVAEIYFDRAKEGGFFTGSNYKKIIKSCKARDEEIDDILIMTERQEKAFSHRVKNVLPNLEKAMEVGDNFKIYSIDECFRDKFNRSECDGIALIYGLKKIHPTTLWFNLDRGDCSIGNKKWTVLLKRGISEGNKIKEQLESGHFNDVVKNYSSWWNDYTMKEYLQDYQETIGKKVAQHFNGSPFDCNHHLVITPRQIPENWFYEDGKWYRRKEERDTSGSTYGLIDLFFSV